MKQVERQCVLGRERSHRAPESPLSSIAVSVQQSQWANLPMELLLDIICRVESSETLWPARRAVVAYAAVCRSWRQLTKEVVRNPEQCGLLTFPMSLKQLGPKDYPIQCFIIRDRGTSTFRLYLGLSPGPISLAPSLLSTTLILHATLQSLSDQSHKRIPSKKVLPRLPLRNYNMASICYELNVLRTRRPRRMHCTVYTIPASTLQDQGTVPTPETFGYCLDGESSSFSVFKENIQESTSTALPQPPESSTKNPLVLRNKAPRWHEQLQCWCQELSAGGRH